MSADPIEVCRFFLSGTCRYGNNCRYSHTAPSSTSSDDTTSPSSQSKPQSVMNTLKWINAPEFVPKAKQQQQPQVSGTSKRNKERTRGATEFALDTEADRNLRIIDDDDEEPEDNINVITSYAAICKKNLPEEPVVEQVIMCPFMLRTDDGVCVYGDTCEYVHGDLCDLCGLYCLNPVNEENRKKHVKECMEQHEKDMELSFAIARSKDKFCGICMEIVVEKQGVDQRFGILQNCNHVFCLECIRKWRQNKEKHFNNEIARACPECRVASDFICPSTYWVGDIKEEKEKLIKGYKNALGDKHCKYFKNGEGKCPFGNKCFYKHVDKFNQKVDVGDPKKYVRRFNRNGDIEMRVSCALMMYVFGIVFDSINATLFWKSGIGGVPADGRHPVH